MFWLNKFDPVTVKKKIYIFTVTAVDRHGYIWYIYTTDL